MSGKSRMAEKRIIGHSVISQRRKTEKKLSCGGRQDYDCKTNRSKKTYKEINKDKNFKENSGVLRYCCSQWAEKLQNLYKNNYDEFKKMYYNTQFCEFCGNIIKEKDGRMVRVWVKIDQIYPWQNEKEKRNENFFWDDEGGFWAVPLSRFKKFIDDKI